MAPKRKITSIRFTVKGESLIRALAQHHGVSMSAILELAIREKAERDGITYTEPKEE